MTIERSVAEPLLGLGLTLGEGARWLADARRLVFVDIPHGRIYEYEPDRGDLRTIEAGRYVAAVARAGDSDYVATGRDGFIRGDANGFVLLGGSLMDGSSERLNDGRCDSLGRFWAGSATSEANRGGGGLYRLADAAGPARRVLGGVQLGNGIGWSPDGGTMYFVDSWRGCVDAFAFDVERGELGKRRCLLSLEAEGGMPDGIAVDEEGAIWVAIWGAGEVRRIDAAGRLLSTVSVPARNVTSCALGDGRLYITTAREGDRGELAGTVFVAPVEVDGLPENDCRV